MQTLIGFQGELSYKVGGVGAGGDYVVALNVKNLKRSANATAVDASTRAGNGFKQYAQGLVDFGIEFDTVHDPEDDFWTALQSAFETRDVIGIKCLDQAGGEGLEADFIVEKFDDSQDLDDTQRTEVSLKPARSDTAPAWVTGG